MTAIDFMKQTLEFIHRGFRGAPEGLSDEQLHFVPEGQSHSIAWCMWHGARIEDLFFQQIFQGKKSEWETGGWAAKTGLPEKGFGTGQSNEEAHAVRISSLDTFKDYQARIESLSAEYLSSLTEADLEREVQLGPERKERLGESINLHMVIHLNGHRGEINLLRGMMGFDPVLLNQGG
ncbi:MAG TPA: DinB family protein [Tepidiformaceae bacterium]|nr:DinB family protein [Tepidiformaceae bacterium]